MMRKQRFADWALVGWSAVVVLLLVAAVFVVLGVGEPGLRSGIRVTARTSVALFLAAFVASACAALLPSRLSKWLLRNRRALGVSFAVSMGVHGALIVALWQTHRESFLASVAPTTLLGGGVGFVFIALMAATSFDRTAALLGRRAWKVLHTVGMYYLWVVFAFSYVPRAQAPAYALLFGLLLLALGLRLVATARRLRRRRQLR
jgi:DMSO/TMAO reductase YedYZ heme-binding membrane subunit